MRCSPRASHTARVLTSPVAGVYATSADGGWHFARHWHDTYSFGVLDAGGQSWASARGRVDAYAGDVMDTNPGEVHDGRPLGVASRRWRILSVPPKVMLAVVPHAAATEPVIARPVISDALLRRAVQGVFDAIGRWHSAPGPVTALAFEEALARSCTLLLARHGSVRVPLREVDANVRVARDRLEHATHPPSLSELAALAGLSRYQLLRRFARQYGLPPSAWLLSQRAERARSLMAHGTSIAGAAAECGFADQSHLTRVFKRLYGYTPGVWRGAVRPVQRGSASRMGRPRPPRATRPAASDAS